MATNQPTTVAFNEFQLFDCVATQIMNTFDLLRDQLIARRDALLNTLQIIKEDYISKETTRKASITELEGLIRQMQELSVKVNTNFEIHQDAIDLYLRKIKQHETPTKRPSPFFSCPSLSQLENQIAEFGEFKEGVDYYQKKEPVIAVGKKGKADNELRDATGLALDEPNQLIYIADSGNSRIQVVSFAGNFLKRFGQGIIENPSGIAVTKDNIFVTDCVLHALLQFRKKDYKLMRRTGTYGGGEGQLFHPIGLCIDNNGDAYVADYINNRVSVFSKDFNFIKCLGVQQLKYPKDVTVTQHGVVVLDQGPNCIHLFSRSGELLRSFVTHGEDGMVYHPQFFCLDASGNILITDYNLNNIKILSPTGQLITMIGKEGHGKGELRCPYGICVTQLGTVFVVSSHSNFSLQSF